MVDKDKQLICIPGKSKLAEAVFDVNKPEPLSDEAFKDISETRDRIIRLKTLRNLEAMLNGYGILCRFDVTNKDVILTIPGHYSCPDLIANSAIAYIISLAVLNGIHSANTDRFILAIAAKNQFNPVLDWIRSKPWDGKPRLQAMCETIITPDDYNESLKNILLSRWFMSAVAALLINSFSSRGVLVFAGPQSIGKTRFVASLIDDPILRESVIKLDHLLDATNKDSILSAISNWIVEIGELESSFARGFARLKGFITNNRDKVRKPYDRRESDFPRRTVFIATVNSHNFLLDDTGNTRWWTIPVLKLDYEHGIDTQQFWAEMLHLFESKDNPQWWLTKEEEAMLEEYNSDHRVISAVEDILSTRLDYDLPESQWVYQTASGALKSVGIDTPTNPQAKQAADFLRERFGKPRKIRGYMVYKIPSARTRHDSIMGNVLDDEPPVTGDDEF